MLGAAAFAKAMPVPLLLLPSALMGPNLLGQWGLLALGGEVGWGLVPCLQRECPSSRRACTRRPGAQLPFALPVIASSPFLPSSSDRKPWKGRGARLRDPGYIQCIV